jgi:hypothetical protein
VTPVVIVILAVVWAAVLIPPMLQNRSQARPADSISAFQSQLNTLQRRTVGESAGPVTPPNGMRAVRPVTSTPGLAGPSEFRAVPLGTVDQARLARIDAQRRRRQVLAGLLVAAGVTLALSFVLPSLRMLHLVIDVLLVAYVALLIHRRKLAQERAAKVRSMQAAQARRQRQRQGARPARPAGSVRPVAEAPVGRHARGERPSGPAELDLRPAATG